MQKTQKSNLKHIKTIAHTTVTTQVSTPVNIFVLTSVFTMV